MLIHLLHKAIFNQKQHHNKPKDINTVTLQSTTSCPTTWISSITVTSIHPIYNISTEHSNEYAWAEFGFEVRGARTWRARAYNGGPGAEPLVREAKPPEAGIEHTKWGAKSPLSSVLKDKTVRDFSIQLFSRLVGDAMILVTFWTYLSQHTSRGLFNHPILAHLVSFVESFHRVHLVVEVPRVWILAQGRSPNFLKSQSPMLRLDFYVFVAVPSFYYWRMHASTALNF